ncbi:MAG: NAD(+) synthase [Candidatus Competibacterales bacterium]|nr:NAD(+) synthase [Candidatus Competibacterales bacterium]
MASLPFDSLYRHGFVRAAVGIPAVRVADPAHNLAATLDLARRAHEHHAALAVFPELGLSAYSNEDLFQQDALLEAVVEALAGLADASRELDPVLLVGAPLRAEGRLFNCAVALHRGRILGVVPKSYLPNYREFYEKRQFSAARSTLGETIDLPGGPVPFGADLLFCAESMANFVFAVEICEDLWTPVPPSSWTALAGATVLANLSASNITIAKSEFRHRLSAAHSGRCLAAYLYSAAGPGESTTDLAWDGQAMIYENGELLAEAERFPDGPRLISADLDLERLVQERARLTSFADSIEDHRSRLRQLRRVPFRFEPPAVAVPLAREIERFPYVPSDPARRDEHCYEAYNIQVHGLIKRLQSAGIRKLVIGVSGGLDSTQALIVAARAMDRLGLPRTHILAYTLPGFATSDRTRDNAHALMRALGVSAGEIDIRPSCLQMFRDIGHPFKDGEPVYDVTFENVQAGERTSHLFRLANHHDALVLGTGDLSELALGWATYGVGDHMSHYNVNASVPKTLIQHLLRWVIASREFDDATGAVLRSILETEISPELVPGKADDDQPAQSTEARIGPYALQDFNLYYISRYGFRPSKVAFLALAAWQDPTRGRWPEGLPEARRAGYDLATIRHWLEVFLFRFFRISQFKRSCVPNGPKVGSGGSLSPRGDWRAPSDSEVTVWLEELRRNVPREEN